MKSMKIRADEAQENKNPLVAQKQADYRTRTTNVEELQESVNNRLCGSNSTLEYADYEEIDFATEIKKKRFQRIRSIEFITEKKKLPVYRETDPDKIYYSVTPLSNIQSIFSSGFKTSYGGSGKGSVSTHRSKEQFNTQGYIYMFNKESNAKQYGKRILSDKNDVGKNGSRFALVRFTLPDTLRFTPDPEGYAEHQEGQPLSKTAALRTNQDIKPNFIIGAITYKKGKAEEIDREEGAEGGVEN